MKKHSSESIMAKNDFLNRLNPPKFDFTENLSGSKII